MTPPRCSGILLHPTSLPGPLASGDLGAAAYHFVDWLVAAGQSLWQMLPVGPVGAGNSPYASPSAFAGNPLLVDLEELEREGWLAAAALRAAESAGHDPARVDFDRARTTRMHLLRLAAEGYAAHATPAQRADFESFRESEGTWLRDYVLFMALCARHPDSDWTAWPQELRARDAGALAALERGEVDEIRFWTFVQWRFFRQWAALKAYANRKGVHLVGDLPIFIALHSAEVWAAQSLFELDASGQPTVVAGVPPDYFSATGQRWGNPLYRWSAHAADGFAWWVARMRHAMRLADLVRIDHFRGFAACWEIPVNEATALNGRWQPAPGRALFEALRVALGELPIIAEDLGLITEDVEALRRHFGLPGMRILQFAFAGDASGSYLPHQYEPNTVVYTGTHDNNTTQGWWAAASEHERAFVRSYLASDGTSIHWDLIRAASMSVARIAIYPLQDVLGLDASHRMNFPGEAEGHWEWRFSWDRIEPWHAGRLLEIGRAHGRC